MPLLCKRIHPQSNGRSTDRKTYGDARVRIGKVACIAGHSLQTSVVKNSNFLIRGIKVIVAAEMN